MSKTIKALIKMKTSLILISLLVATTFISSGQNTGRNNSTDISECNFTGSFSNAQNGAIWFIVSQNGKMTLATNGENATLIEIDKNQCARFFGSVDNIICVKQFGAWLLCQLYKPTGNWNTNYLIYSSLLQPIYNLTPHENNLPNNTIPNQSSNTEDTSSNDNSTKENVSDNLQNENSNYELSKTLKTSHIGHFNDEVINEEYSTQFIKEETPSIVKNLFYKGTNISLSKAKFGASEKYIDDGLTVKQGDTLFLNITCMRFKDKNRKEWDGKKTEYLLSIQIEDNTGKEYFLETFDQTLNIRKSDSPLASIAKYDLDVPIVIDPKKMLLLPTGKDLYLSILVKGKIEKKSIWEGFVKFKIK